MCVGKLQGPWGNVLSEVPKSRKSDASCCPLFVDPSSKASDMSAHPEVTEIRKTGRGCREEKDLQREEQK